MIDPWTTAYYASCLTALFFITCMIVVMSQTRFLTYSLFAFLLLVVISLLDGTFQHLVDGYVTPHNLWPYYAGCPAAAVGFLVIWQHTEPTSQWRRFRKPALIAAIASVGCLPLAAVLPPVYLYSGLNGLTLLMILGQVLPPLSWSETPSPQQNVAVVTAIIASFATVGFYVAVLSGFAVSPGVITVANKLIYLFLVGGLLAIVVTHVFTVDRDLERALRAALAHAEKEAALSRSLYEAEVDYARAYRHATLLAEQLAAASHDLRQPMLSLRTALMRLSSEDKGTVEPRIWEVLDYLEDLAQAYGESAEKTEGATDPGRREVIEVRLMLQTLASMFGEQAERAGVELRMVDSRLSVVVEPLVMVRVLSNVVSNAMRHAHATRILVGCRRREGAISIEVHDDGCGMSDAMLARVLAAGEKGPDSDGEGLGLAIVQRLAAEQHLDVDFHSRLGAGTRVSIALPVGGD